MSPDWHTLSQLYHEALAFDASERAAFLDAACAGDEALRQELQSLLEVPQGGDSADPLLEGIEGRLLATLRSPREEEAAASPEDGSDPAFSAAMDALRSKSSPFAQLRPAVLRSLLAATQRREYAAGDYLIRQGDPAEFLLVIVSGTAWARVHDARGARAVGEFGAGDVVGEMSLITAEPRTADVLCRTPVRTVLLSAEAFHALADRHADLRVVLTNLVAERLGQAPHDGLGGKDINGYRIVQCVGRGGMGVVYEAQRLATGETIALKMMSHRLLYQQGAVERFHREAGVLKTLDHPSIARLYDAFPAYKTQFLAMEFCTGRTLNDIISARGPLDESIVRRVVGQLAVALKYIHALGIVHRDLKPSNVMVSHSGSVKLLDFGLVKFGTAADRSGGAPPGDEPHSTLLGTPRYMAPELFWGQEADHRSDYYALACVVYEALTGKPAVEASDVLAIVREQVRRNVPPRDMIGGGVSEEMHRVLKGGLEPSPARRSLDLDLLATWAAPIDADVLEVNAGVSPEPSPSSMRRTPPTASPVP